MTKEQEEAVERLKNMNDGYTFKDCDVCDKCNEKSKCCDEKKCEELKAIDIVLSMLEEKDKQIAEEQKAVEQIYADYQDIGKTAFDYQERIELLEKVIDLMAEVIEECRENGVLESDEIDLSQIAGTDKVKQYFENKVRQESDKGTTGR